MKSTATQFLEGVKARHRCTVHAVGTSEESGEGTGVTLARYGLKADLKDGSTFSPKQVQMTRWENGRAKYIKFYNDPARLQVKRLASRQSSHGRARARIVNSAAEAVERLNTTPAGCSLGLVRRR